MLWLSPPRRDVCRAAVPVLPARPCWGHVAAAEQMPQAACGGGAALLHLQIAEGQLANLEAGRKMTEVMTASFRRSCSDKARVVLLPLNETGAPTDICTEEKEGSCEVSLSLWRAKRLPSSFFFQGSWMKYVQALVSGLCAFVLCRLNGIERAEQTSRCDSFSAALYSTRLRSPELFIACCDTELRHPGTKDLLVPSGFLMMPLLFHWLLGSTPRLLLSNLAGTCTFLSAAAPRVPAELINNLFC